MRCRRGPRPPWPARLLLRLVPLGGRRQEVETDLLELFEERAAERGRWYASLRYCRDVASLWIHRRTGPRSSRRARRGETRRGASRRGGLLDGLLLDVRFAVRMFRRQIGVVSVTVAGLALALGICTVVFSIVNALSLRPFGVADPSAVVEVFQVHSRGFSTSWPHSEFVQLRAGARLASLEAYLDEAAPLGDASAESVGVSLVSGGFFELLGGRAAIGRGLTDADVAAASRAVVVNHGFWERRLGGDRSIVGQTVRLMGTPFTVVGVLEEGFTGPTVQPPAFYAPLSLALRGEIWRPRADPDLGVRVVGRLADGATRPQAGAELAGLAAGVSSERAARQEREEVRARLDPLGGGPTRGRGQSLAVTTLVLGLVLLLACANVAGLLLAGTIARRREVGLRLALGASRGRIVRQLLTESVLLGMLGGALGLLCAWWLLPVIAVLVNVPATVDVAPDVRVYAFLSGVTTLAGLGAGLAPARYGARGDIAMPLEGAPGPTGSRRPGRARSTLIGVQAAASILLLVLAALLTRTLLHAGQLELGFDADRLVSVTPRFAGRGGGEPYDGPRAAAYWSAVLERVAGLPGVDAAALAQYPPYAGLGVHRTSFDHEGHRHSAHFNRVSPGYFATAGIRIVRGRTFSAEEVATGASVAMVTEGLARELWGDADALGATLEPVDPELADTRIVGIAADALTNRLDEPDSATIYRPLSPADATLGRLVVRGAGDATTIVRPVLEAVRAVDTDLLPRAIAVRDGIHSELEPLRIFMTAASILGAIALGLAAIGVFGMTAFAVEQRTGEIGVRMAVGAGAGDVVCLMLRDSLRPVAAGLAVGLLVALAGSRVLDAYLYGLSGRDPLAVAGAVVILLAAAAVAAAVPTRRAARVDPVAVLRRS